MKLFSLVDWTRKYLKARQHQISRLLKCSTENYNIFNLIYKWQTKYLFNIKHIILLPRYFMYKIDSQWLVSLTKHSHDFINTYCPNIPQLLGRKRYWKKSIYFWHFLYIISQLGLPYINYRLNNRKYSRYICGCVYVHIYWLHLWIAFIFRLNYFDIIKHLIQI